MERRAKKSDCRATTKERPNMPPFFPRRRRHPRRRRPCTANPIRRLLLLPRFTLITNPPLPLFAFRSHLSQRNITTISIPADIAGR